MPLSRFVFFAIFLTLCFIRCQAVDAQQLLYPDIFPFVEEDAPSSMQTLQNWQRSGDRIIFSTMFANQGDGLFEIRKGDQVSPTHNEMLQRVYIDDDFGSNFIDIPIGTTPIPGTPDNPNFDVPFPADSNLIWFEDFTTFSLYEAPVVDGAITLGAEVASDTKTSWRLSANRGPLPGYDSPPRYSSPDQSVQQRISVGWADIYGAGSSGQFIDILGVPSGPLYWLRQTVDPLNRIQETDETNNSFDILIDLNKPGEAIMFAGEFVQPGDAAPRPDGDLTSDGEVNLDDWFAFKAGQGASLVGLDPTDAIALGDLNLDGKHSLADALLFRQYYDDFNGSGAFARMQATPEPTSIAIVGAAGLMVLASGRRLGRRAVKALAVGLAVFITTLGPAAGPVLASVTLFSEDFDGLPLGPNVDEGLAESEAWTDTPPAGWTVDDSGVPWLGSPSRGVEEWEGWSFADTEWWAATAGNQGRSDFTLGSGTVAVADPDEWDDRGSPINGSFVGYYNALFSTPSININSAVPRTLQLAFASSWRDEAFDDGPSNLNNQTARVRVSYNGGASFSEVLRWESDSSSPFFKDDATNEQVLLDLNNPAGASDMIVEFGLLNAGNDWWWAIDNVEVFAPSTLSVNTVSGQMTIQGAENLVGYEITGPQGALDPAGWSQGNLDSQNYGSSVPATADFNNDGVVNIADYTLWRDNLGATVVGDADGDQQTSAADYSVWVEQFGAAVGPSESWETLIAEDDQLVEFFLGGSSSFPSAAVGKGYNQQLDLRNLSFNYALSDGQQLTGSVVYSTDGASPLVVPEPTAVALLAGMTIMAVRTGREKIIVTA